MTQISIYVASMSGTAEFVAEELIGPLRAAGYAPRLTKLARMTPKDLADDRLAIVCSSTYGTGEVPDESKPFLATLVADRPDLSHMRYGVIALGDMQYPATFCGGGLKWDRAFAELGAQRVGPVSMLDRSSGLFPEDVALEWLKGWLARVHPALTSV